MEFRTTKKIDVKITKERISKDIRKTVLNMSPVTTGNYNGNYFNVFCLYFAHTDQHKQYNIYHVVNVLYKMNVDTEEYTFVKTKQAHYVLSELIDSAEDKKLRTGKWTDSMYPGTEAFFFQSDIREATVKMSPEDRAELDKMKR